MQIDLRRTAIRMRLRGLAMAFIFAALIMTILLSELLDKPLLGIGKAQAIYLLTGIYILAVIYNYIRDYHYIYFSDEGNKLILRYYSMRPLSQAKRSIEIPKGTLSRYELKSSLLGLRQKLILFQKVKGGVYKYPGVSITALAEEEKKKLLQALRLQLPR